MLRHILNKYGRKDGELRGNAPAHIKAIVRGVLKHINEKESTNQLKLL